MKWFYVDNGQQAGPVEDSMFQELAGQGKITPETLVWREGLENWMPYSSLPPAEAQASVVAGTATGIAKCSECGRLFAPDELIQMGNGMVCANCKPMAVQKLKEGVELAGEYRYGGFWIRFAAKFVDGLILAVVQAVLKTGVTLAMQTPATDKNKMVGVTVVLVCASLLIRGLYDTWFVGKFGATPGKMACGLKVIRPDGAPVSYGRACGRFFSEILSGIVLYIGYIMAAFDEQKRALHDRICDTRVIYK